MESKLKCSESLKAGSVGKKSWRESFSIEYLLRPDPKIKNVKSKERGLPITLHHTPISFAIKYMQQQIHAIQQKSCQSFTKQENKVASKRYDKTIGNVSKKTEKRSQKGEVLYKVESSLI